MSAISSCDRFDSLRLNRAFLGPDTLPSGDGARDTSWWNVGYKERERRGREEEGGGQKGG